MFTGLIAEVGTVREIARDSDGAVVTVAAGLAEELREGDSVAVEGVCLTASSLAPGGFRAQAVHETLARSALASLAVGDAVNLELAVRPSDRLGGHFVQGHVDGVAEVTDVREDGFSRVITLRAPEQLRRYLVEKGSVAISGVSLTVSALTPEGLEVSLIPETLARTTLGLLAPGTAVNIEVDVLAKHIERLLEVRT